MKAKYTQFQLLRILYKYSKCYYVLIMLMSTCMHNAAAGNGKICPGSLTLSQATVCVGDCITVTYAGPQPANATYVWTSTCGTITGGNNLDPHTACFVTSGFCTIQLSIQPPGSPAEVCDVMIQVHPKPKASFGADQEICEGTCATLQVTATGPTPYTVTIFDGSNTTTNTFNVSPFNFQVCPSATTTYTLTSVMAGPCGPVNLNSSTTVNVNPGPNASIVQNGNSLVAYPYSSIFDWYDCNWNSLNYYTWIYYPPADGCYSCVVTDPVTFCSDTVFANYTYACALNCSIVFDDTICAGDMVTFSYAGNASDSAIYNWTIDLPGAPGVHFTGIGPITLQYNDTSCYNISLTVTDSNCTAYCTGVLCVKEQSWSPQIFQQNGSLLAFPIDSNFTYSWHPCNDTTVLGTQQIFTPLVAGCYCCIFTDKCGCKDTACIDFPVLCNLTCNFIGADSICLGDSVTLIYTGNGSTNATYNWLIDVPGSPGLHFIGSDPKVIAYNVPGCYHISLTVMENNCLVTCQDSFCVKAKTWNAHIINQNSSLSALPNDADYSYSWTHCNDSVLVSTQQNYTPGISGCYCVIITDDCGFKDTACADINVFPCDLICSFTAADSICAGDSITLTYTGNASLNATYNWFIDFPGFPAAHYSGVGPIVIKYDIPGCYHVSLSVQDSSCFATCYDSFCVVPVPTAHLCCDATKCGLCHDLTISFTGTPPWYAQISDGSNTTNLGPITSSPYLYTVCPTDTTTYTLLQVAGPGNLCQVTVSGSATINLSPYPTASISVSGDTLCASPSNSFYGWWTCNGSPYFSTDQCVVVSQPGCYCVTVSTNLDCVDSACIVITKTHNIIITDKIIVYPVPSINEITLQITDDDIVPDYFELLDLRGILIKRIITPHKVDGNKYIINIRDVPKGLHFVKTYTKDSVFISKFIKM